MQFTSIKQAKAVSGNVSTANSKMPGSSYPADPFQCVTGQKMAKIKGTPCHGCYALRIAKFRTNVAKSWANNQDLMVNQNRQDWIAGTVHQITKASIKTGQPYHRWFDAGDLASVDVLDRIVQVAIQTPEIAHWLPTQERAMVAKWLKKNGSLPANLIIRISASKVDGQPPKSAANTSAVFTKNGAPIGHVCPASQQGNACGDCRACWSFDVANVSYPKH
jgi:hypothetical protein